MCSSGCEIYEILKCGVGCVQVLDGGAERRAGQWGGRERAGDTSGH